MNFSPQQDSALQAVSAWLRDQNAPQVFRLFGYAGTGKTTLAKHLAEGVNGKVMFGAYTGKASLVLRSKGCYGASTIHSMIYKMEEDGDGVPTFSLDVDSDVGKSELVIIDECSMVDEFLGTDLLSFGTKVLVLGDPAQLPPVKGAGYFTNVDPDFMLTEIHRQAAESPIIRLATEVRQGGKLKYGQFGDSSVIRKTDLDPSDVLRNDQILVGLNRTRHKYNARLRELNGFIERNPMPGDRLVCLKNSREQGLFNGGIWSAETVTREGEGYQMRVKPQDAGGFQAPVDVLAHRAYFEGTEKDIHPMDLKGYQAFDYGYALTVHKSQGSQWPSVMLFNESYCFKDDAARWLYTGLTRAAETVTVVM